MPVSLPTPDQLKRIAEKMNLSLTDADVASFLGLMKPSIDGYNVVDQLPDNLPPVKYPRTPGYRPAARGEQAQRLVLQVEDRGRAPGQAQGQARRDQGQRDGGGGADDERGLDPRGLHSGDRRDRGDPHPGRGRHHPRQGPLRVLLPLRRQPHQRDRSGAQPVQEGLLGGRLVVGERGAGGARRGRHGDRRRPGRIDPDARFVLRHLRDEGDPRARALHRHHADRDLRGPHRPDDRHRGRQRAAARGDRGAGRLRSAPVLAEGPPLHPAPGRRGERTPHRGGEGGLRASAVGGGGRRQGAAGRRSVQAPRGHRHRHLDPGAPARGRPLAARSASRASPRP